MKPKVVCLFTGTRADYPRIKTLVSLLEKSKKFELKIIVTGSHLLKKFGFSYKEIIKDGYKIHRKLKNSEPLDDTLLGNTIAFSKCPKELLKL